MWYTITRHNHISYNMIFYHVDTQFIKYDDERGKDGCHKRIVFARVNHAKAVELKSAKDERLL